MMLFSRNGLKSKSLCFLTLTPVGVDNYNIIDEIYQKEKDKKILWGEGEEEIRPTWLFIYIYLDLVQLFHFKNQQRYTRLNFELEVKCLSLELRFYHLF
jgi:hypothetical protein